MLILRCPCCGVDACESELAACGEAHLERVGPDGDAEAFEAYLFLRRNTRGAHLERWRHVHGCGKWFLAARDTRTMQVFGTYPAQSTEPPAAIRAAMDPAAIRAAKDADA